MENKMNRIKVEYFLMLLVFSFSIKAEVVKPLEIEVYRSPTCGCCSKWIDHLKEKQFIVKDYVVDDVQLVKDKNGVPKKMASCHTALVNGYVVEGHVPAKDIMRLLKEKPKVVGISVPGMPVGTPGMEMGGRKDPYEVVSFDKDNNYQVFSKYE
jgi:hypothetical protein